MNMIRDLRHWWKEMQSSFWFVPSVIVVGAVVLATSLIMIDTKISFNIVQEIPFLFGADAIASHSLLTIIASSMITVAEVVFSITIVALSLTSSQYTSRVLRNFMRDRNNQVVLGVFLGIFAYCLVVIRVIRDGEEGAFIPSLSILGGLILAFVGIAYLIFFIHYISMSIQSSSIIAAAAEETITAIDNLFPQGMGDNDMENSKSDLTTTCSPILARNTGYVERIDEDSLMRITCKHKIVVRMESVIGEFIIKGSPLICFSAPNGLDVKIIDNLYETYHISRHRTVDQDAGFGIRQLVDISLKALSPGVNDTTTAVMCINYLAAILVQLASRSIPTARRLHQGELRMIARAPSFPDLLAEAFNQIRQNAEGNSVILARLLYALEEIAAKTTSLQQREAVQQQAELIDAISERTIPSPYDRKELTAAILRLNGKTNFKVEVLSGL
jgi:uncharacterized membrane protein